MFAGLILFIPVVILIGFTVWCVYRCRLQAMANLARPSHAVIKVEEYHKGSSIETEEAVEADQTTFDIPSSYFAREPTMLSGHSGGWGPIRRLSQAWPPHRFLGEALNNHLKNR